MGLDAEERDLFRACGAVWCAVLCLAVSCCVVSHCEGISGVPQVLVEAGLSTGE